MHASNRQKLLLHAKNVHAQTLTAVKLKKSAKGGNGQAHKTSVCLTRKKVALSHTSVGVPNPPPLPSLCQDTP